MTVEAPFAPHVGIPKTSFSGSPEFGNATWFNLGDKAREEAEKRWAAESTPKARRLARREKADLARVYVKAQYNGKPVDLDLREPRTPLREAARAAREERLLFSSKARRLDRRETSELAKAYLKATKGTNE